jgi:geranylgeranyl diphosphate synthase type II
MVKVEQIQELVNSYIENQDFGGNPKELYAPIEYILRQGGKRMRPTLCLLACDLFNGNIEDCMVPAVAAEIFHNFTLVHDDIMDQAPLRRGMETVYHKWNSDIALLSGDTMLIKAFQYVLAMKKEYSYEVFAELCKVALEVCEGQQFDLNFETQDNVSLDAYLEMIRLKTAVLLGSVLKIGAIVAGTDAKNQQAVYDFGINLSGWAKIKLTAKKGQKIKLIYASTPALSPLTRSSPYTETPAVPAFILSKAESSASICFQKKEKKSPYIA